MDETACSHCASKGSIGETLEVYYCSECGWWGVAPDKIVYAPETFRDEDYRQGQVPRRPTR
jgi:hypothetical protein